MTSKQSETVRWDWTEDEISLIEMSLCFTTKTQKRFAEDIRDGKKRPSGKPFTAEEIHKAMVTYHKMDNILGKVRRQLMAKRHDNQGRLDNQDVLICGASESKREE